MQGSLVFSNHVTKVVLGWIVSAERSMDSAGCHMIPAKHGIREGEIWNFFENNLSIMSKLFLKWQN